MTTRLAANVFGMLTALCLTLGSSFAHAIPALQVYIEGATYDAGNETWVLDTTTASATVVIAATTQNGGSPVSPLTGVTMVVSALTDDAFSATLTGGDASLNLSSSSTAGNTPLLNGGDANNAVSYLTFALGNFGGTADTTIDYVSGGGNGSGNVQSYELTLFDLSGTVIIDAYGYGKKKLVFAPYSHNGAIVTVSDVPELSAAGTTPAAALLLGSLMLFRSRRRRVAA